MLTNDKYMIIDGQNRLRAKVNANDNGGRNILTAFHKCISTVVVIVQLMFEIENNKLVNLKQALLHEFNRTSSQIRARDKYSTFRG